ncbi:MAG: M20/M25/M40 family metallo-hydrolase, partial [Rhodospirillales bacterium]|nr:M20/M25/M40 family metallo-hydrolase [Rhodospirillales bacterium]
MQSTPHMPDILANLETLVAFDTTSAKSNLELIAWLEDYHARRGGRVRRMPSPCGKKAGLWAVFGPADKSGIVLSGHTDVVPTVGQSWSSDPYQLRRENGRLFGRGCCDMKGFIAVAISIL